MASSPPAMDATPEKDSDGINFDLSVDFEDVVSSTLRTEVAVRVMLQKEAEVLSELRGTSVDREIDDIDELLESMAQTISEKHKADK